MISVMTFILAALLVILAMLTFDQLIIIEKERFLEQWKNDGSPATFYRQRSQFKRGIRESFATNKCSVVWLFTPPQWTKDDEKAKSILRRYRIVVAIWNFVAMPLLILSAVWSG